MGHSTQSFPGMFSLLLSADSQTMARGLRFAGDAWIALLAAEERAREGAAVEKLLKAIVWSGGVAIREVFVRLSQFHFKHVPDDIKKMLKSHFGGWGQSAICENAINRTRDIQREAKHTHISNANCFYSPW